MFIEMRVGKSFNIKYNPKEVLLYFYFLVIF